MYVGSFDSLFEQAAKYADLNTQSRQALFLATVAHESNYMREMRENMTHYTPERLAEVWPKRFRNSSGPTMEAQRIAGDAFKTAEAAYGGREGNGPKGTGDGFKYRGAGPGHLTFKNNFKSVSFNLYKAGFIDNKMLFVDHPELVATAEYGLLAFADWWKSNKMNIYADDIEAGVIFKKGDSIIYDPWPASRKKVQGGTLGLENVKKIYDIFCL